VYREKNKLDVDKEASIFKVQHHTRRNLH